MTASLDSGVELVLESQPALHGVRFWSGDLVPYVEEDTEVTEDYQGLRSTLMIDQEGDYLGFDKHPQDPVLDEFYNSVYPASRRGTWYNVASQYEASRWTSLVETISRLARESGLAPDQLRVHDVGCGFGGLVNELRRSGYEATGTDLCREAITSGNEQGDNPWIFDRSAQDYLAEVGPQNVIVLNHMIEHSTDPLGLVQELVGHLVPGGFLLIRCPNSRYVRSRRESIRASWYGFPKHLHYFGPESLDRLLRLSGLTHTAVRCTDTDMEVGDELARVRAVGTPGEFSSDDRQLLAHLRGTLRSKEIQGLGRKA